LEHLFYFDTNSLDNLFARYGMRPTRETSVLYSIPSDAETYLEMRKASNRRFRRSLRRVPGIDFVHLIRADYKALIAATASSKQTGRCHYS